MAQEEIVEDAIEESTGILNEETKEEPIAEEANFSENIENVESKEKLSDDTISGLSEETSVKEDDTKDSSEQIVQEEPKDSILEAIESSEEEKIEINIPEDDDKDDISDDLEFNFSLTDENEPPAIENPSTASQETINEPDKDKSNYKKILVIDDSLVIRKMVEIALEDEELIIETAVSGKEGLAMMDKINPNLVILDMMLPDINGIEILKTIKASKGIPVIMLSGKDSPQLIETAKAEGAEEFLPKPFKDDDLVEKIKNLI